jgi:hypothetical protein
MALALSSGILSIQKGIEITPCLNALAKIGVPTKVIYYSVNQCRTIWRYYHHSQDSSNTKRQSGSLQEGQPGW